MIKAEIVADSLSPQGDRLTSLLVTFPRIILAEVNTHRMLSKNTSSSRAIPFKKMVEAVQNDPFIPIAWQKHHSGMQGTEYFTSDVDVEACRKQWLDARDGAVLHSSFMYHDGTTKQLCNRLLEPFMWTTMLITGPQSGWDNFFELRCPSYQFGELTNNPRVWKSKKEAVKDFPDWENNTDLFWITMNKGQAEIHIMDLAEKIYDAMNESIPEQLKAGEWHIPFKSRVDTHEISTNSFRTYHTKLGMTDTQLNLVKVSTAMAARTSYTVVGDEKVVDIDQMIRLHDRLIAQNPPHSSPMEHCAKVMSEEEYNSNIKGQFEITHSEPEYEDLGEFPEYAKGWCRNFKGFIPYRHIIENTPQQ